MLTDFSDFTNMSYYLKKRESELSEEFGLSEGVPSHDVFLDIFRGIDIEKFMDLFVEWTKNLVLIKTGQLIVINGKAL
ncbi:MAG: transposase family protein [Lachnospiraceae bacterium]|nr:transposase family protein [Lachnospiraceae bacterium]